METNKLNNTDNVVAELYDSVIGSFSAPITFANKASAIRWFKNHKDPNKVDYILFQVGTFNSNTGDIIITKERDILARGTDYVKEEEEN